MKIDLPPIAREELAMGAFKHASADVRKEIQGALKKSGPSDLSDEAISAIRKHLEAAIDLITRDKWLSKEPTMVYHRTALQHGLSSLSATPIGYVEAALCLLK